MFKVMFPGNSFIKYTLSYNLFYHSIYSHFYPFYLCFSILVLALTCNIGIFAAMLSKKTKYAINALVYLAREQSKAPVQISKIAESEHIPRKFLEAILLDLRNAGMLSSRKGKTGGYYLLKSPDEINIAEVVRLFEGAIALLPCVAHKYYERCEECKNEEVCGIRDVFADVRNETVNMLKNATLSSIIERERILENEVAEKS